MGYALFPQVVPGIPPHVSIGGYNLGISAYSPVLTGWAQGGPIAIHGTNEPDLIPGRINKSKFSLLYI